MTQLASTQNTTSQMAGGLKLRPAEERGKANFGWLDTKYSFSFSNYYDPRYMQFENLRVINDDIVAGGSGFPQHGHRDAEIFSYILDGALEHKDSMGNGSTVAAGGVQYMSAGNGVMHSEFNPSKTAPVRLLQVWLLPNQTGVAPRYDTMDIDPADKDGKLKLFLSPDGRDGSMSIRADSDIYAATLSGDQEIRFDMTPERKAWVQLARGNVTVNGEDLREGDGLAITQAGELHFSNGDNAEFLLFELGK